MRRWALLTYVVLHSVACGGASKDAASPADAESEGSEAAAPEGKSGDAASDDSSNVRKAAGTPDAKGGPGPATQSADD
ncbi:MAG TPA: hypothetical protein VF103_02180, partial [Polyangiaceae bacterium]